VCVEESDLQALEAALVAHQVAPGATVVSQITNAAVGRALSEVTGPGTVLDVADLAAPSIVQACLGEKDRDLQLGGTTFRVTEIASPTAGSLRVLFGDLVPLAVVPAGSRQVDVCPGRDRLVAAGDAVTVLGTPMELETAGYPPHSPRPAPVAAASSSRAGHPWVVIRSLWGEASRGLHFTLCAIVVLLIASSIVLHFTCNSGGRHLSVVEALYLTVVTLSTVGYGDFSFAAQGTGLQVFAISSSSAPCSSPRRWLC